jgi:hypothetical protein
MEAVFEREVQTGRIAVDRGLGLDLSDRFDDVGVFDSVLLARPYRMLLALSGAPPDLNVQTLSGGRQLSREALASAGVVLALTTLRRTDLERVGTDGALSLYRVPRPEPRVSFHPASAVSFETEESLLAAVRSRRRGEHPSLSLVPEARLAVPASPTSVPEGSTPPAPLYRRPSGDRIEVEVEAPVPGFLKVLESHDPGWSAVVDGRSSPLYLAAGFAMAVPLPAGPHQVVLRYETPGATAGRVASLVALGLLLGLLLAVNRTGAQRDARSSTETAATEPRSAA